MQGWIDQQRGEEHYQVLNFGDVSTICEFATIYTFQTLIKIYNKGQCNTQNIAPTIRSLLSSVNSRCPFTCLT